ncbi:MAG: hypothetical protein FD164_1711 [Nitrospirae bacterium]|nr:MAG: hypothetical protein FD164_1711 [Nitrospirota bacterium]
MLENSAYGALLKIDEIQNVSNLLFCEWTGLASLMLHDGFSRMSTARSSVFRVAAVFLTMSMHRSSHSKYIGLHA